jgi:DnaJ like chaperone protein
MAWLGKLVGGTLGFALGGPLGAIAGAAFGHAFDSNGENGQSGPGHKKRPLETAEKSQLTFFVATFSMLAKLAKADGQIAQAEVETIDKFMLYDLNLNPQSRQVATSIFQAALHSPGTFEEFAAQFYRQFQSQPQMLELILDILFRVAVADGRISTSEEQLLIAASHIFNFDSQQYGRLKSRYVQNLDKYYAVLQSSPDDSDDQIKHNYRKQVSDYHPDKIAAKGLPDEFNKFAHDKFREIQEAYDIIKKERGIK